MTERKTALIMISIAIALLALLVAGPVGRSWAQDPGPGVQSSAQALVPPLIQYQGRLLTAAGQPVEGFHQLVFRLYPASDSVAAAYVETDTMTLVGGLVSTEIGGGLGWDPQVFFSGQQYWLGVSIDLDPQELSPRQQLLPVPYALGLVPGAVISGTASPATLVVRSLGAGDALKVEGNTSVANLNISGSLTGAGHPHDFYTRSQSESRYVNTGGGDTIYSKADTPGLLVTPLETGVGIWATAPGNVGLRGETGSANKDMAGVLGLAGDPLIMLDGTAGVLGKSVDGFGTAGISRYFIGAYASGPAAGVLAESDSGYGLRADSNTGYGVRGTSSSSYGVYGSSSSSYGVYGRSSATASGVAGVYGASSTGASGVYGYSTSTGPGVRAYNSGAGPALEVLGNAGVTGIITSTKVSYSSPRVHYLSVAAEAFRAMVSSTAFSSGWSGAYFTGASSGTLVAPIQLPDGAVVQYLTGYFYDGTASNAVTVALERHNFSHSFTTLGTVSSSVSTGYSNATSPLINHTVSNATGGYYVYMYVANNNDLSSVKVMGARIQYTVSEAE